MIAKFTLFFLFIINFNIAQIKNGIAQYNFIPSNNEEISKILEEEDKYGLNKMTIEASTNLEAFLVFNDVLSTFYIKSSDQDKGIRLAAALYLNCPSRIVVDLNQKLVLTNNQLTFFSKEKYVITDSLQTNWVLINESKTIDNYLCYKAMLNDNLQTKKGEVIAWYCPQIPFSFGPKGFGGLPGLILELSDKRGVLGLKTLSFNTLIDDKILNIKGEKTITLEDYNLLIKKLIEE
jgi:GLPGLI family protein